MKVIVCGDVRGHFAETFGRVAKLNAAKGPFEFLLCCGTFFGDDASVLPPAAPIPTYFFEAPTGYTPEGLPDSVKFLGRDGIVTIERLTVAYLASGATGARLAEASRAPGYCGADVLLTTEWPRGVDTLVDENTMATMRSDGVFLNALGDVESKEAVLACRPRYHFAAKHGVYWQRQPYRPHMTRFVALGEAAKKKAKWLHAIDIEPIPYCDPATLKREPPGTTDSPFEIVSDVVAAALSSSLEEEKPKKKRKKVAVEESATLFLGGVPAYATADRLKELFAEEGGVEDVRLSKNCAFVDFKSVEDAVAARSKEFSIDGRKLNIDYATAKKARYPDDKRTECWFCLASPSCESHLVLSVGPTSYVAMPKGPLIEDHALVVPIDHRWNLVPGDAEKLVSALAKCFAAPATVAFERYVPSTKKGVYHAHLQVVPIQSAADCAAAASSFVNSAKRDNFELSEEALANPPEKVSFFRCDFYDASGKLKVSLSNTGSRVPLHFGRAACARLLGISSEKAHWKACELPKEEETRLCEALKEKFRPFDPFNVVQTE